MQLHLYNHPSPGCTHFLCPAWVIQIANLSELLRYKPSRIAFFYTANCYGFIIQRNPCQITCECYCVLVGFVCCYTCVPFVDVNSFDIIYYLIYRCAPSLSLFPCASHQHHVLVSGMHDKSFSVAPLFISVKQFRTVTVASLERRPLICFLRPS